jgi:glycosyltransferase involved in cell wall biosynthesis
VSERPLRILYLVPAAGIPACGPSGASAHVRGITAGLAALGHRVELFTALDSDARGALEAPSVPYRSAGAAQWPRAPRRLAHLRELRTARGVARAALAAGQSGPRVDLVIERHALYSDAGLRTARALDAPLLLEVNAPQRLERQRYEGELNQAAAERWERRALQGADRVACVSRWLAEWAVDEQGCDAERVRVIPNGVQGRPAASDGGDGADATAAYRQLRAKGRATVGLDDEAWVLGFLGAFRPWHGLQQLPPLLERLPDARLLMVGGGRAAEQPLWRPLIEHPRVVMAGRRTQPELPELVAAMDLGLAPYPADAPPWFCPLKVLDYRAQGTPVLATRVADCPSLVGDAGSIVPPGDLDALAAAARSWRGRRCVPMVRSWTDVARELLAHCGLHGGSAEPLASQASGG